jgi:cobalt-zinc-cadmium efflux system protein
VDARDHASEAGALRAGLAISAALCAIEIAGGIATNSLALLTDAVHMFTDVAALAIAWFALWICSRPASAQKTFGYYRAEILAAFVNGVVLCLLVIGILVEAWRRLGAPPPVAGRGMLAIAVLGLAVNMLVAWRLHEHRSASLNLRGAYLHVLSDVLGSVGAIAAGLAIVIFDWRSADAVASIAIAGLILRSSWALVGEAVDVLMEAVPPHVEMNALQVALEGVDGVYEIHDLHVWTLTTGRYALSAHAVATPSAVHEPLLTALTDVCRDRFGIDHVTIQIELENRRAGEPVH